MTQSKTNPFAQSEHYWKLQFMLPASAVGTAEDSFSDVVFAVSNFETDKINHIWSFELISETEPDIEEIKRRLMVIGALHGIPTPVLDVQKLEQQDWLAAVARDFPPLTIGRFYVHGKHVKDVPTGLISIQVEAGAAFGSGEHGTTSCCLEALDFLSKKRRFQSILDMGTGSGILAIAAAKLWKIPVVAVDIDPVAARVTLENAITNRVQTLVAAGVSDGYNSEKVKKSAPYDLIISNILARPLIEFAPALAQNLKIGGVAVLSGLLKSQEKQVMAAHMAQGLKLSKRFIGGEWCTLVIEK